MDQKTRQIIAGVREEELIKLLGELVKIPSPTGEEKEIAEFMAAYGRESGYSSINVGNKWSVVGRVDGAGQGPRVLFLTHSDHARPAEPEGPYALEVADGGKFNKSGPVALGKGACAPKGTLAAMLLAGAILARHRSDFKGSAVIAAVCQDLNANHDGPREVHERGWIEADMAVVGEPSHHRPVLGARGISHIGVKINGQPTHWGRPAEGSNPIWTMAPVLAALKDLTSNLPRHPDLGQATLAPFNLDCRYSAPHTPSWCRVVLDRRTLPGEDSAEVLKTIKDKLSGLAPEGQSLEVDYVSQMFPFQGSAESLIAQKVMAVSTEIIGQELSFGYLTFSSNGGYLTGKMGMPSVVLGPGRIEDIHPVEHIEIESLVLATKIYLATVVELTRG